MSERTHDLRVPVSADELARIRALADAEGMPVAAYVRLRVLGDPGRTRRPSPPRQPPEPDPDDPYDFEDDDGERVSR